MRKEESPLTTYGETGLFRFGDRATGDAGTDREGLRRMWGGHDAIQIHEVDHQDGHAMSPAYLDLVVATCVKRIRAARDKAAEGRQLVEEINELAHDDVGNPITRADRLLIVDRVRDMLVGPQRRPGSMEAFPYKVLGGDNSRTIELIRAIRALIK